MAALRVETNKVICDILFGEVVFAPAGNSVCFSNFLLAVRVFIVHVLVRIDGELVFDIVICSNHWHQATFPVMIILENQTR